MKLLLDDNHPLYLEGLRSLALSHGITVVGMARDGLEALDQTRKLLPDTILMEMQLPNCDGLTATQLIKAEFPWIKIIILSNYDDEEYIFEALKVGASGFLTKDLDIDEFNRLIEDLPQDGPILPNGFISRLFTNLTAKRDTAKESFIDMAFKELTDRQMEILSLVAEGFTYKEIGAQLYLTERTVKYHMKQILSKLHLSSRKQAVGYLKKMQ
ncbi:MAG: response regulator transcription factor, partial [Bacteroidota bacterium]